MTTALTFNSVTLSPVQYNAQIWLRSCDIAKALGYKTENAITKIYNRNSDEFSNDMTVVPNLGTTVTPNKTRLFSPRGCHLIAMFARTAVAKQFRRWVLDVLDKVCAPADEPKLRRRLPPSEGLDLMEQAVRERFNMGMPFAKSGKNGLFQRRSELPPALADISKHKLEDMANELLACGRVERDMDNRGRLRPMNVAPSLNAMPDSERTKTFRELIKDVREHAKGIGATLNKVAFAAHPGGRDLVLPPELETRYRALDQIHKLAVAGLYQAQHTLYCLYYLGEGIEFSRK